MLPKLQLFPMMPMISISLVPFTTQADLTSHATMLLILPHVPMLSVVLWYLAVAARTGTRVTSDEPILPVDVETTHAPCYT
jgi:hypothetical protein